MTQRSSNRASRAVAIFSLCTALAPAPQDPAAPARDAKAIAAAKVPVCQRMVDYHRATLQAPPRGVDPLSPAERYAIGYEPIELWSRRLADAKLDATTDAGERLAILQGEVDRIGKFVGDIQQMANDVPEWKVVADRVSYYKLDAEYRLAKEKAGK